MRKYIQPLLTFFRWSICHTKCGYKFTQWYYAKRGQSLFQKRCRLLQKVGYDILKEIGGILEEQTSDYYVEYGTLLGLFRDKGFIKYDDDIDYGIAYNAISPVRLLDLMLQAKLTFKRAFVWKERITELTFVYKGIDVDFFYLFLDENDTHMMCYDEFVNNEKGEYVARRITHLRKPLYQETKIYTLNDVSIRIPNNVEEFLSYNYGENWRTPIRNLRADDRQLNRNVCNGEALIFTTPEELKAFENIKK